MIYNSSINMFKLLFGFSLLLILVSCTDKKNTDDENPLIADEDFTSPADTMGGESYFKPVSSVHIKVKYTPIF